MGKNGQMWNWIPLPRIEVFTSKKKARKFYKEVTGKDMEFLGKAGEAHYLESSGRYDIAIIFFDDKKLNNISLIQRIAMISHECSHIIDDLENSYGEKKFATETRAYLLDSAVAAVCDQLGEEWFTKTQRA